MKLPTTATVEDIGTICTFLANKPAGAANADAVAALGGRTKGKRKLAACRHLGFIEKDESGMTKITDRGSRAISNEAGDKTIAFSQVISDFAAYRAVIDDAARRESVTVTAPEVISFWQKNFPSEVSTAKTEQGYQSGCVFRMLEGAGLGEMTVGKPGRPTRFDFDPDKLREFSGTGSPVPADARDEEPDAAATAKAAAVREAEAGERDSAEPKSEDPGEPPESPVRLETVTQEAKIEAPRRDVPGAGRIFITGGVNERILDQVRELAAFGKLEAVVEQSRDLSASTMHVMRSCKAVVIHADAARALKDENGREVRPINEDALISLGAAMAILGRSILLLAEDGVELPAGLPDVRVCRYSGGELDGASIMTLIKVFNELDFD